MKILLLFFLVTLFTTGIPVSTQETTSLEDTTTESPTTTAQTTVDISTTTIETSTNSELPNTTLTTEAISTTEEPVTTSAPPVTTTKAPGPEECAWNITRNDVTCIRADLKISFTVPIEGKNYDINLGCSASSKQSDCSSNETQTLILYETSYNLTMIFEKEDAKFYIRNITFAYNLPAGEGVVSHDSDKIFSVKTGNSYLCKTETSVHLGNVTMQILEIHVQAFGEKDNKNFGSAEECEADDKVSDIVPIAVGVALAALIIIVLIAYLVGRRRSRQKGYQSV